MQPKFQHLSITDAERYYWDAYADLQRALCDAEAGWQERRGAGERVDAAYKMWHSALVRAYRAYGDRIKVSAKVHEDLKEHITGGINSRWAARHD
jgi:hypothetical protein